MESLSNYLPWLDHGFQHQAAIFPQVQHSLWPALFQTLFWPRRPTPTSSWLQPTPFAGHKFCIQSFRPQVYFPFESSSW